MGDMGEGAGEFAGIAISIKTIVLTTLGKLVKVEVAEVQATPEGNEVYYSVYLPTDLEFYLKVKEWVELKEQEFDAMGEEANPIDKISEAIKEFSQMLDNVSFKTSISVNTFAMVVDEDGQERIYLDLMGMTSKVMQMDSE
jgi:hypothetical protein